MGARDAGRGRALHITIAGAHRRGCKGIVVHRAKSIEAVHRHGLPVTAAQRTLLDLAATDHPALPKALNEAQVLKLVSSMRC